LGEEMIVKSNPVKEIRHKDNIVAYFCNIKGEIILAPDTRMHPHQCGLHPLEWRRCEAVGAREIESISRKLSAQNWEKKKAMSVGQHLREKAFIDQMKARCKIRMAQAHSANDVSINKQILDKMEKREDDFMKMVVSTFDVTKRNTALDVELSEESTSVLRNFGKKRQGVAV
jgi:cell division FtsZ-interacting protein ZapD